MTVHFHEGTLLVMNGKLSKITRVASAFGQNERLTAPSNFDHAQASSHQYLDFAESLMTERDKLEASRLDLAVAG